MKKLTLLACAASFAAFPVSAQEAKKPFPAPAEIIAAAKAEEWLAILPSDLLVMDLAPDSKANPSTGSGRRVVIQLMPTPFSVGWVGNIRKLATARFWDGTSINRVQDNYVVQWGDATEKKALPDGLAVVPEKAYAIGRDLPEFAVLQNRLLAVAKRRMAVGSANARSAEALREGAPLAVRFPTPPLVLQQRDAFASATTFNDGWPVAVAKDAFWPVHCYAMVGVGRNLSPDTGTGAELYTVIGHAPRHLDRNIALVGRVIEGIEHLSSLPRGTGALGFYESEAERTPITSVRLGNDVAGLVPYEYLSTESQSFAAYADARANRRDPFFIRPAGGADICNIPVPVRRKPMK